MQALSSARSEDVVRNLSLFVIACTMIAEVCGAAPDYAVAGAAAFIVGYAVDAHKFSSYYFAFNAISVIFDIIFLAAWQRSGAVATFLSFALIAKIAIAYYCRKLLAEISANAGPVHIGSVASPSKGGAGDPEAGRGAGGEEGVSSNAYVSAGGSSDLYASYQSQ
jgi:hypothetical protein